MGMVTAKPMEPAAIVDHGYFQWYLKKYGISIEVVGLDLTHMMSNGGEYKETKTSVVNRGQVSGGAPAPPIKQLSNTQYDEHNHVSNNSICLHQFKTRIGRFTLWDMGYL